MVFNDNSKVIEFDMYKNNKCDIDNLNIPRFSKTVVENGLVEIDNEYYYAKYVNEHEMINELIGTKFSKALGLDTVDYKIGTYNDHLCALSKLFYKKDYNYHNVVSLYRINNANRVSSVNKIYSFLYTCNLDVLNRVKDKEMILNILKLIAIDLRMNQIDRHMNNLYLKEDNNGIVDLAPIFDYSNCYYDLNAYLNEKYYINPFVILRKNKLSLLAYLRSYPDAYKYIKMLLDINIDDVILDIENDNNIELSDKEINIIRESDNKSIKLMKSV